MRKGNIHTGLSYVNPDGGVERPSSEENESGWEDRGKMGNEKEAETSRLIPGWVRNFKKKVWGVRFPHLHLPPLPRPACPFGFNQVDGRSSRFSVLGRGWIYYQWAIICVTAAY